MLFGILTALISFQRIMGNILPKFLDGKVVFYMDDILMYTKNLTEYRLLLSKVMHHLKENGLTADIGKCIFEEEAVQVQSCMISKTGDHMAPLKVETITKWGISKTVKRCTEFSQVRQLLQGTHRRICSCHSYSYQSHWEG